MKKFKIYTTTYCGFCQAAKSLLRRLNLVFEEIPLDNDPELRRQISKANGNWPTVPMIFMGDQFIGGYSELLSKIQRGEIKGV